MKKVLQQGDIIRIAFDPSLGQEQQGVRPALVVSVQPVNALSNRVIVAAISNGDQLRTMDIRAREATFIETAPQYVVDEVLGKLAAILGIEV